MGEPRRARASRQGEHRQSDPTRGDRRATAPPSTAQHSCCKPRLPRQTGNTRSEAAQRGFSMESDLGTYLPPWLAPPHFTPRSSPHVPARGLRPRATDATASPSPAAAAATPGCPRCCSSRAVAPASCAANSPVRIRYAFRAHFGGFPRPCTSHPRKGLSAPAHCNAGGTHSGRWAHLPRQLGCCLNASAASGRTPACDINATQQ